MIKKWSYVAAAMLTASSGLVLTGCIDNDEPYGIEQIRVATANLLDAKKAAVNAEQAAKQAEIEIEKIKAEVEKLRIEKEKIEAEANARYRDAEAKHLEALAEAERLKAEGQKTIDEAEAQRILAEAAVKEAEAEKWRAEAEKIRKEAESNYQWILQKIAEAQQEAANDQRDADRLYAEAIYWFEKTKADNANAWNKELWAQVETAFNIYLQKIKAYNEANYNYQLALNHYAEIEADLVWVEKDQEVTEYDYVYNPETEVWETITKTYIADKSGFVSPKYGKKKALLDLIAEKERIVKRCEKNIAELQQYEAELETLNAKYADEKEAFDMSDWAQLLAQYEEKLEAAEAAVEQAKLEKEALKIDQADVFAKPVEAQEKYIKFIEERINIDKYEIQPIAILSVLNSEWSNLKQVTNTDTWYQLDNPFTNKDADGLLIPTPNVVDPFNQEPKKVKDAVESFNFWIRDFKLAMLDENDVAWSEARKTEMERQLIQGENDYAVALKNWTLAKEVYNNGDTPVLTNLPNEENLEKAIEAYNALNEEAKQLQETREAAQTDYEAAWAAWEEAQETYKVEGAAGKYFQASKDFDEAKVAASAALTKDLADAQSTYDIAQKNISLKVRQLEQAFDTDRIAYEKLQLSGDATEAELTAAKKKMDASLKAYDDYANGKPDDKGNLTGKALDEKKAQDALDLAQKTAQLDYQEAVNDASAVWHAAEKAYLDAGGDKLLEKDPAYAPYLEAQQNFTAAEKARDDAQAAIDNFSKEDLWPLWYALKDEENKQLADMGLYSWKYQGAIPQWVEVYSYIIGDYEFVEASIPANLLYGDAYHIDFNYSYTDSKGNEHFDIYKQYYKDLPNSTWGSQVYANARWLVEETSEVAFGQLGWDYDRNDDMTYDWESDKAFLLPEVTPAILDKYITNLMISGNKANPDFNEEDINQFMLAQYYKLFGAYGNTQDLAVNIAYAQICIDNKDNNAITDQINGLTAARDAVLSTLSDKQKEAQTLWDAYEVAYNAKKDLTAIADAKLEDAVSVYNTYKEIVSEPTEVFVDGQWVPVQSLSEYVASLESDALGETAIAIEKLENMITAAKQKVENQEEALAKAQEALELYNYQLTQFESEEYSKVENPYKYEVEYWEAEVARLSSEMDYWKKRYEELQAQYEAKKKEVDYPA